MREEPQCLKQRVSFWCIDQHPRGMPGTTHEMLKQAIFSVEPLDMTRIATCKIRPLEEGNPSCQAT